jgi:hypothetical protein
MIDRCPVCSSQLRVDTLSSSGKRTIVMCQSGRIPGVKVTTWFGSRFVWFVNDPVRQIAYYLQDNESTFCLFTIGDGLIELGKMNCEPDSFYLDSSGRTLANIIQIGNSYAMSKIFI